MDFLRSVLAETTFYAWGAVLIVGVPLLILILGEWIERLRRSRSRLLGSVSNFRNLVLPLLSLRLIMEFILNLDNSLIAVRVVETLLWLMVMYSLLQLFGELIGTIRLEGDEALGDKDLIEVQETHLPRVWSELLRLATVVGVTSYVLGGVWGAPMEQVLTALGVGSIVIGFALQDTLSSLASGLLLAFEKPFEVGDWASYKEFQGQIVEMNWRSVRLRTLDRDVVVIPNSVMGREVATNFTLLDPLHAERLFISFSYHHPPNEVKRMLLETTLATPGVVAKPLPLIRVVSYAYDKFAINYEVKLYTIDYSHTEVIRDEVLTRIYYAAQRYNFKVPYQTTIFYQRDGMELEPPDLFPELLTEIQTLPYFARLDMAYIHQLAKAANFQHYGTDEWLIEEGMSFKGFYIILDGEVQLTISTADGQFHEITTLTAGNFFGETLLLRNQPTPFNVVVKRDMKAMFIERTTMLNVVESNTRLATEMNRFIDARAKLIERILKREAGDQVAQPWMTSQSDSNQNGASQSGSNQTEHEQNGGEQSRPGQTASSPENEAEL
ncbi:MAG: mechanosensitive ion channel family protein [Chloroflexota bacterium]